MGSCGDRMPTKLHMHGTWRCSRLSDVAWWVCVGRLGFSSGASPQHRQKISLWAKLFGQRTSSPTKRPFANSKPLPESSRWFILSRRALMGPLLKGNHASWRSGRLGETDIPRHFPNINELTRGSKPSCFPSVRQLHRYPSNFSSSGSLEMNTAGLIAVDCDGLTPARRRNATEKLLGLEKPTA